MSQDNLISQNEEINMPELASSEMETPQAHMMEILKNFEMMTMKSSLNNVGLDISLLDKEERAKLLDIMKSSEDHAFEFSKERLASHERITNKTIESKIVNQKTIRYVLLGGGLILFVLAFVILFFREQYFSEYIAFIAGLGGGFGIKSFINSNNEDKEIVKDE